MSGQLAFVVHGIPAPQGSKRHLGHGVMVESSKAVRPWRDAVRIDAWHAATEQEWQTPRRDASLWVSVVFTLRRPASHYGHGRNIERLRDTAPPQPSARPDLDKLVRATLDGLTDSGAIIDDSQVVALTAAKCYPGSHLDALDLPGAVVLVSLDVTP